MNGIPISLAGQSRSDAFKSDFQTSVGGLQNEIDAIVRRVLDGHVLRPHMMMMILVFGDLLHKSNCQQLLWKQKN